ncbi:MAG: hypothetical protein ABSB71_05050 [Candidatus Bathyarchaeia archaeon]
MSITPDKSYNIQIFKGNNWELTIEKSNGIEALNSPEYLIGRDMGLVDLRLKKGKDKNHYRSKLNKDGEVIECKDLPEVSYNMILNGITTGNLDIDHIKKILELLM